MWRMLDAGICLCRTPMGGVHRLMQVDGDSSSRGKRDYHINVPTGLHFIWNDRDILCDSRKEPSQT